MPSAEELGKLYATPHQHERWTDHRIRVDVSATLAYHLLEPGNLVVDLSCGDAAIAQRLAAARGARLILGDFAPGYEHTGPIEETLQKVGLAQADLWILSETLEHLDDPDAVLREIRLRSKRLLLSTPDGEADDSNPEHIWAWDSEEVGRMLVTAGFEPLIHTRLDLRPAGFLYCFQIWAAS
jgi:hypothetical protein